MRALANAAGRDLVRNGEIVTRGGARPLRFHALQGRTHVASARMAATLAAHRPAAFVAFDLLMDGAKSLLARPWCAR